MKSYFTAGITILFFFLSCERTPESDDHTEITKWQDDKTGAVTITFDDSTINHFRIAIPMMDSLGLPGTFYIITGAVPDSEHRPEFIGRPVEEIIEESDHVPTNEENLFERASAIRYLGYEDVHEYHTQAGQQFERGDVEEAIATIDEGYANIREGKYEQSDDYITDYLNSVLYVEPGTELITWEEIRTLDGDFHEFGSHSVTHPYLAVMDEANIRFELEKSREELRNQLGREHTFSAEAPFGTEDERVMEYLYETYPANRNRMPEPFLEEILRGSEENPGESEQEYVQWQRGPLTETPMDLMKSWVDTTMTNDNIWLVLVFHGVEGIGWEPKSEEELETYFSYIKEHEDDIWIATFEDVTKYLRQRMNADLLSGSDGERLLVDLEHSLGEWYTLPMTLKTRVPSNWQEVTVTQGNHVEEPVVQQDDGGNYILYQAAPNEEQIVIQQSG